MSSLANWSYEAVVTVWPAASYDQYGQPTFGTPYTLQADWAFGGDLQTDATGNEFVAQSKYYFELADESPLMPVREGYVKRGDHTASLDPIAAGAEQIKKVSGWPALKFGQGELPDWILMT